MTNEEIIMPSLYGTTVANNYGKMSALQTYGVGENYTNFGTRQITLIKVAVSGGINDMTKGSNGSTGSYTDALSLFAVAIRSLQQYMEIYAVYPPVAGGFMALVAFDTSNTANSGNGSAANTSNLAPNFTQVGLAATAVQNSLNASASVTITAVTPQIGTTL